MSSAILLTGLAPYRDPWHGLSATSDRVAELLSSWGVEVVTTGDLETVLLAPPDLLVVNLAGRGPAADPGAAANARALTAVRDAGVPVLALHSSAIAFGGIPVWRELIGGRWEPGVSGHPQIGQSVIHVLPGHPITEDLTSFRVYDERYSRLTRDAGVVLAAHVEDGVRHELAWALETAEGRRAVYDGLGHAVESYDSAGRTELLRREVRWLIGDDTRG